MSCGAQVAGVPCVEGPNGHGGVPVPAGAAGGELRCLRLPHSTVHHPLRHGASAHMPASRVILTLRRWVLHTLRLSSCNLHRKLQKIRILFPTADGLHCLVPQLRHPVLRSPTPPAPANFFMRLPTRSDQIM